MVNHLRLLIQKYPRLLIQKVAEYLGAHKFAPHLRKVVVVPLHWFWKSIPKYLPFYVLVPVICYATYHGLQRATVISTFHLPPVNKEKPLPFSGETVADVLKNGMTAIRDEAEGRVVPAPCDTIAVKDKAFGGLTARAHTSFEVSGPVTVEVNGFSASAVISEARQVLGRERTISGDVVLMGTTSFQLIASANDAGPWTVPPQELSADGLKNGGCLLAEMILTDTDKNLLTSALIRRGQYPRVIGLYTPIALYERDPDALNNLGVALLETGTSDQAIVRFRQAIALAHGFLYFGSGSFPEVHYNLANAFLDEGHPDDAVPEFRRAIAIKPEYAEAHCNLGYAFMHQGHPGDAIPEYRTAIALKPDFAEAYNFLGNAFLEQGHPEVAIPAFREAIALKPDFAGAYNNVGNALLKQGHLDDAITAYRRAIDLEPGRAEAYNNLGYALSKQGHYDQAIPEYRTAIVLKHDYARAHYNLGNALLAQGHYDEAISECREALTIKPDFVEAQNSLKSALAKPSKALPSGQN